MSPMTTEFFFPPPIKKGDTIGVMAPSSFVEIGDVEAGASILLAQGYKVDIHPQTYLRVGQSAGTHEQKRAALHDLIRNPSIKAIVFSGGGNRCLQIINDLDFNLIKAHPKAYMGFSDTTALLTAITRRTGLITYHGPLLKKLPTLQGLYIDSALRALTGEQTLIPLIGSHFLNEKGGKHAVGRLWGGNFSMVRALMGSPDFPDLTGALLFLEDVGEELSHLDRHFCQMRRAGYFDEISGLILGHFGDMKDTGRPFGFTFEEIIAEYMGDLHVPVILNAPFGHGIKLITLPIGAKFEIDEENATPVLRKAQQKV